MPNTHKPNLNTALTLNAFVNSARITILNQQNYPCELCELEAPTHLRHKTKRREYVYSRQLLFHLAPELQENIVLQKQKKPIDARGKVFFSTSHSAEWTAIIMSYENPVSVDIQVNSENRLQNISPKFLNRTEPHTNLTERWAIKECLYKYFFPQYSLALTSISLNLPQNLPNILQRPLVSLQPPYSNITVPRVYFYRTAQWSLSFIA